MDRLRGIFALFLCFTSVAYGQNGKLKALIIGNSSYTTPQFPDLRGTPIKDANQMSIVLTAVGFKKNNIIVAIDQTRSEFDSTLLAFAARIGPNDSVLIYYSGHGFALDGIDYLVPVDFSFEGTKRDVRDHSVALTRLRDALIGTQNSVIVLDACRTDAPLLKKATGDEPLSLEGFSPQGIGTLVAYSTSQGKASQGSSPSGMSLYTSYLVETLRKQPRSMLTALEEAKVATAKGSANSQIPAVYNEMNGSFVLLGPSSPGNVKPDKGKNRSNNADDAGEQLHKPKSAPQETQAQSEVPASSLLDESKSLLKTIQGLSDSWLNELDDKKKLQINLWEQNGSPNTPGGVPMWEEAYTNEENIINAKYGNLFRKHYKSKTEDTIQKLNTEVPGVVDPTREYDPQTAAQMQGVVGDLRDLQEQYSSKMQTGKYIPLRRNWLRN